MNITEEFMQEQSTMIKNLYHKYELLYTWLEEKEKTDNLLHPEDVRNYISRLDEKYPTIIPRNEDDRDR